MNGILLPRNCFQFPLVQVTVSKIAYIKLENTKNEHSFHDKPSKSRPRKIFRDIGWIILIKKLTGLIRAINRTNSWTNQTCRGEKRCQWRKEQPDVTKTPPKKTHTCVTFVHMNNFFSNLKYRARVPCAPEFFRESYVSCACYGISPL